MGKSIVDIQHMGDALRNTGYKNIESAVSEIVDNSVEAEAKDIFIILREGRDPVSNRKIVNEIGFLDNGVGMDADILGGCLGIGSTTRFARKGMGRFGVGLPQASLYACPHIEVYSWQDGIENCKKVFLDIEKVKSGEQTEIEDPILAKVPKEYRDYIKYKTTNEDFDFSKSGTLVVWKCCDRITPKTRVALKTRLEAAIGQKFRHFIHDKEIEITIIPDENREGASRVRPNDPLFLMEDNYVLCDPANPRIIYKNRDGDNLEPVFEPYTDGGNEDGVIEIPVQYLKDGEIKSATVKARFSIVKDKFYDKNAIPSGNPGALPFGQYAAKMEGISVVRANREIDFRQFDFYSILNEPAHRWWGCEICFDPELDEAFGVANNKQYVELKEIEKEDIDEEDLVQPMWCQLADYIKPTIKAMYGKNEETRKNTRSGGEDNTIQPSPSTVIVDTVEEQNDDEEDIPVVEPTPEDIEKGKEELEDQGVEQPTDDQVRAFLNSKIHFHYKDKGERELAFDYKIVGGTLIITVNISHVFYKAFLERINSDDDVNTTFELMLASLFMSVWKTNKYQQDENDTLVSMWNSKLKDYITEQIRPKK